MVLLQRPLCLGTATEPEKEQQEKNCAHVVGASQLKAGVSLKVFLSYCATMERNSCQAPKRLTGRGGKEHVKPSTENP